MEKRLEVRVQAELLERFDKACEDNFATRSEVLRQAMVSYVRQNQKEEMKMTNKIDFGTIEFEGKEYELQTQAEPTSRLLPDELAGRFEMAALAIGEDNQAYEVSWIFEDDGRELDEYDYTEVCDVQPADVPVYTVQMVRGTEGAWDETHEEAEVIFRTLDLKEAFEKMEQTSTVELDSHDLEGNRYFLAPALIRVWGEDSMILN